MGDRPLKKRLKKSSAEPEGHAGMANGRSGRGGQGVTVGLNPLVGHKVDRFWADVSCLGCDACIPSPVLQLQIKITTQCALHA